MGSLLGLGWLFGDLERGVVVVHLVGCQLGGRKWGKREGAYFCDTPVFDCNGGGIHAKVDEDGGRGGDSGEEGDEKGAEEFTAQVDLAELGV